MTIEGLAAQTSVSDAVGTLMLKKGLDQAEGQVAQLLQSLPPAPQPAHLGGSVDRYV